jgi:opacity protein-like surface antigen
MTQIYFGKTNVKPYIYGGLGLGLANNNATGYGTTNDNIRQKLFIWEAGCGFAAFINEHISFDVGGAYSYVNSKYQDYSNDERSDKIKGFGFNIGISLFL